MIFENIFWRGLRKVYRRAFGSWQPSLPEVTDPQQASDAIYERLASGNPCMIGRFGATEMACITNYLGIRNGRPSLRAYLRGEAADWRWNKSIMAQMRDWSGFFPPTEELLTRFCERMLQDAPLLDICGTFSTVAGWLQMLRPYLNDPLMMPLRFFEPYQTANPWSRVLEGRRVVVVHPYAELIERQYARRTELFPDPNVLPAFRLRTVKAVQSLGGDRHGFKDWFEALEWMEREMEREDFDVCLLGCGAYGFPLAAHAKRLGRQAVHIGGALQLLFGIKGARWERPSAEVNADCYRNLFARPAWVRPDEYRTAHDQTVENNCYW